MDLDGSTLDVTEKRFRPLGFAEPGGQQQQSLEMCPSVLCYYTFSRHQELLLQPNLPHPWLGSSGALEHSGRRGKHGAGADAASFYQRKKRRDLKETPHD